MSPERALRSFPNPRCAPKPPSVPAVPAVGPVRWPPFRFVSYSPARSCVRRASRDFPRRPIRSVSMPRSMQKSRNLLRYLRRSGRMLVASLVLLCSAHATGAGWTVQTDQGAVRGVVRNGALEFRGIPYAAAPVGELRWALPQPAAAWEGVRDASEFGSACPQQARFNLTEASADEDCLTLNVSVPVDRAPGERLPVFVWIHGGAFVGGASSLYRLDQLARDGRMVVVSMNYRLG